MKSIYSQAWKRIVITFDDETCEPVEAATMGEVSDEEIELAILAASGPMQGWELEFVA
ncbi:hypothetical protein SAMN05216600_12845 [Pseudomonas cuatrocienegasensis]|uniref:Uncharacterized protein n=1 Tax=Pseudomonas cuatrocienegasensis TaxID=543360 RepID=A0ABY1BR19_9PSED|nr:MULTISPECIES: hypothetical protein [Pseudomonas]SER41676.1 hypothetical protein SAMN05216600_12845 [Pseudomonas cuatrocienegasensis]